ncbi:hypothetical protein C8N24_6254 [Solirubrobacter pauli]|uniref:SUKH superfamily protein n=1 Tax=Solirubrobacter pauli TaxID=166793 RepID=A0A660L8H5_9ACTN|nr:hypothetical protein [Solirubrobacter pauli]RKQ88213.1 hypothetical protein C8N24_6254 [Solirubrobacter pauli]
MSPLNRITQLVAPPSSPRPSTAPVVECRGHLQPLPTDYRALLNTYGLGAFRKNFAEVHILSPANPHPVFDIVTLTRETAELLETIYEDLRNDWLPHAFWPDQPGLLQWGAAEIESLWWLTEGEPDEWPTVVMRDTEQIFDRFDMTATELLLGLIDGPSPTSLISPLSCPGVTFSRSPARAGGSYD